jgi:hypothetical protein
VRLHGWAEVPDVALIQRSIPAQVDEGFDPEKGDSPPKGNVVFWAGRSACPILAIVKGIKGHTHDLTWLPGIARHAEYEA